MDAFKLVRDAERMFEGATPEQRTAIMQFAKDNPAARLYIPAPGCEPGLNGVTVGDLSALVINMPEGQNLTTPELVEALGGNRKSASDKRKVKKLIPDVPEIDYQPGRRPVMLRRLTGPAAD